MKFPTLSFWSSRDPEDSIGRIDRALHDRNHRLSAGLSVSDQFDVVRGALVVSQGNGKYLRIRHVVESSVPIPKEIRSGCLGFIARQHRDVGQLAQLLSDLAETQATVVEQLKCSAGKYVDRVLSVAVCDPGYWEADFDGRVSYTPMCDATRLAELSGVTVIDSFPARDLAVGGNGRRLEALPLWMIFADRNPKLADQKRAIITLSERGTGYVFPASDGRDAEVPSIRMFETAGLRFLDALISRSFSKQPLSELERIYADGRQDAELYQRWENASGDFNHPQSLSIANNNPNSSVTQELDNCLIRESQEYLDRTANSFPNVFRTAITWIVDSIVGRLGDCCPGGLDQIFVSNGQRYELFIIDQLTRALNPVVVSPARNQGVTDDQLHSVVAAVLGLFHVDQMPANVPWLTGADGQRILGRITPGRPANWRQLVRVMADFHPAPMKLKDAV